MNEINSYRTILRSSSIMGAASATNVVVGLVRIKIVAVLLGPAGVGLIGLYINLLQTAATVSAFGIGTVGTRQIAEANGRSDAAAIKSARSALFWATLILGLLGGLAVFLAREPLAALVLGPEPDASIIGWLGLGVALSVAANSQHAYLTGLRRIGDIGRLTVLSAAASCILGLGALLIWGAPALLALVLIGPAASFAIGHLFVGRITSMQDIAHPSRALVPQWRQLVRLGVPFMLTHLITIGGFLAIRALIRRHLGAEALGQFQAAWGIGTTYLGFVLGAMSTDYYPRLSGCISDAAAACRMVNEQTEVALLLTAPPLIALLALSPWVVRLLYTNEFVPAVAILHWQLLGDLLKVMSWPLGFVILAAGAGRAYIFSESIALAVFILGVALGLASAGVVATGIAFLAMYVVYLPVVYWLARWRIGFRWTPPVVVHGAIFFIVACGVSALSRWSEPTAAVIGLPAAGLIGLYAVGRLGQMAGLSGPPGRLAALARSSIERLVIRHG